MAQIYQSLKDGVPLSQEELQIGSHELQKLHQQRGAMRILENGTLEIRVLIQGKPHPAGVQYALLVPEK